uniref:Uncharacterized protein n=1 Tax=Oryza barthii TaxID=65489 RepID=A0A0D3H4Y1_9ORYZ
MTRAPRRKRQAQHRCTSSSSRGDGAAGSRAESARAGNFPAKSRFVQLPSHSPFPGNLLQHIAQQSLPISHSLNLQLPSLDLGAAEMSTAAAARKKKGGTPEASDAAAAAPAHTLGRGVGSATAALPFSRGGRGVGLAPPPRSLGRGGGPAVAEIPPGGFPSYSASMDGFPFPPPFDGSYGDGFPSSSAWLDASGGDESSPGSW